MAYGTLHSGRVPNSAQESGPWRIGAIVPDFTLEDVWALPVEGGPDDFQAMLELVTSLDPARGDSRATRFLWQLRDRLGAWFRLGRIRAAGGEAAEALVGELTIPETAEMSLAERLPGDLRGTASDADFGSLPFSPLYRTDIEAAAEISNPTVHGVAHLAWVERDADHFQGQMAVYVKPRGRFGRAYMALIKPFRYWIVYPALLRQVGRAAEAKGLAGDRE